MCDLPVPTLVFFAVYGILTFGFLISGAACMAVGSKKARLSPTYTMLSVPLCPTEESGVFVGAPAIGQCSLNISELSFVVDCGSTKWREASQELLLVHNLREFASSVSVSEVGGSVLVEKEIVREGGAPSELMGEIMSGYSDNGKLVVGCPVRPTLATSGIEPQCSTLPGVEMSFDGQFEAVVIGETTYDKDAAEVTLGFGKLRARVADGVTPALYFVSRSALGSKKLLLIGVGLFVPGLVLVILVLSFVAYVMRLQCLGEQDDRNWAREYREALTSSF